MSNFIHVNQDKYILVLKTCSRVFILGDALVKTRARRDDARFLGRENTVPVRLVYRMDWRQSGRSWCSQHTGSIELWQKTGVYFSSHVWMSSGCHKDAVSSRCHWRHAALGKIFMFVSFTLFPSLIIGFWLVWERCEVNSSHVRVI